MAEGNSFKIIKPAKTSVSKEFRTKQNPLDCRQPSQHLLITFLLNANWLRKFVRFLRSAQDAAESFWEIFLRIFVRQMFSVGSSARRCKQSAGLLIPADKEISPNRDLHSRFPFFRATFSFSFSRLKHFCIMANIFEYHAALFALWSWDSPWLSFAPLQHSRCRWPAVTVPHCRRWRRFGFCYQNSFLHRLNVRTFLMNRARIKDWKFREERDTKPKKSWEYGKEPFGYFYTIRKEVRKKIVISPFFFVCWLKNAGEKFYLHFINAKSRLEVFVLDFSLRFALLLLVQR